MAAKKAQQSGPQLLSVTQAAALLGRSTQWVHQLVKAGYIVKEGRGNYPLVGLIRGSLAYYEDQLKNSTKTATASRATEARAKEIELRIAERERHLIPIEEAIEEYDIALAAVRKVIDSFPAQFTRDLEQRRKAEAIVHAGKEKIADAIASAKVAARTGEPTTAVADIDP